MPLPSFVERNPQAIGDYVAREYSIAADAWELMAVKFGKAYSVAAKAQETVLQTVKARKLAKAKADQAAFNFILSILTVGIAGGVGGALARGIFADTQKNAIDAAKQIGQFGIRDSVARIQDILDPVKGVHSDIFERIGPDPVDYYLTLKDNILTQKNILNIIFEVAPWGDRSSQDLSSLGLTRHPSPSPSPGTSASEELANSFLDQPFLKDKPDALSIDVDQLTRKMRLALWMAWAYVRDIEYWHWDWQDVTGLNRWVIGRERIGDGMLEAFDWDPVRRDLVTLGVPGFAITFSADTGAPYHQEILGLDVWGFCQWVASPAAPTMLFANLPTQPGFPLSMDRMTKMRLTPHGWLDLANPGLQAWLKFTGGTVP